MNTNSHSPKEPSVGTVYLVGAGPGDAGLITRRGYDLLHNHADVVLVDALVDPSLLAELPAHVERRYVGKRAGHHVMKQDKIQELLVETAKAGKNVVRLKGGDPLVFGRGGEEAVVLREAGIPYEIVPGITAATAATAYSGIPLTFRRKSCYAVLFTANAAPAREGECGVIPLADFAKLKDGTLVAYMGVRVLAKVAEQLIKDGMPADQPAAVIERGATGAQKVVRAPLSELAEKAKTEDVKPPALIVIGEVTELPDQIAWYEPGPLATKRVVVTRPVGQARELVDGLRGLGAEVLHIPAIRFEERFDRDTWDALLTDVDARRAKSPGQVGWLVFTSENGVRFFFNGLRRMGRDIRFTGPFKLAAVGVATGEALAEYGLTADLVPQTATGKALGAELAEVATQGDLVIRVRGELGNPAVETALANADVTVSPLTVYTTLDASIDELDQAWMHQKDPDYIVFTSGSTLQAFRRQWGDEEADRILNATKIVSIGPVTSSLIRGMGYDIALEADPHNNAGILEVLKEKSA
ncbi:uroporphyrinogen-III C-methyltransferase [bacterium]|nr:uroporphyrinogen-III C-methyltransferase [bacterium]